MGTKDGPNINDLDCNRVTDMRFCADDKTETVRDQWMSSGGRSRTFKKRWTGCSIFQLKVPGKHPAEVQVIGSSDEEDKRSTCSSENRLVFDNVAIVEALIDCDSREGCSYSHGDQSESAGETEALIPMNEVDLGFLSEMPYYDDQSGSEVAVEDQDPGTVACACSSCQVETAIERCENEDRDVCSHCVQTCSCGLRCCVRCFYKPKQQCLEENQVLKVPSDIFELQLEAEQQIDDLLQQRLNSALDPANNTRMMCAMSVADDDGDDECLAENTSELENIPENDESHNCEESFEDCQELNLNTFFQDVVDEQTY